MKALVLLAVPTVAFVCGWYLRAVIERGSGRIALRRNLRTLDAADALVNELQTLAVEYSQIGPNPLALNVLASISQYQKGKK